MWKWITSTKGTPRYGQLPLHFADQKRAATTATTTTTHSRATQRKVKGRFGRGEKARTGPIPQKQTTKKHETPLTREARRAKLTAPNREQRSTK